MYYSVLRTYSLFLGRITPYMYYLDTKYSRRWTPNQNMIMWLGVTCHRSWSKRFKPLLRRTLGCSLSTSVHSPHRWRLKVARRLRPHFSAIALSPLFSRLDPSWLSSSPSSLTPAFEDNSGLIILLCFPLLYSTLRSYYISGLAAHRLC